MGREISSVTLTCYKTITYAIYLRAVRVLAEHPRPMLVNHKIGHTRRIVSSRSSVPRRNVVANPIIELKFIV